MYEHPRAPALLIVSILLLVILHVFNSAVVQGGSEASQITIEQKIKI